MSQTPAKALEELAEAPSLVLATYLLVLAPLALYVYHDILDTRWRPVWRLIKYLICYIILYILSGSALIVYIVIEGVYGKDYKEVGASVLALILGTYGFWKLIRLVRIIIAHHHIVKVLQNIDEALGAATGLKTVGLEYHLFRPPKRKQTSKPSRSNWDYESRHDFISSSLFDDDYPGEAAARIRWLAPTGKIVVRQDDAEECAARLAIWMRLVLRRPRSEPWRLLTSTSPLVQGHLYRVGLGKALRDLITYGSATPPPRHANVNPAQELLNGGSLSAVGVGIFWIASEMSADEMTEVLAEMPPRWMRGVTQNGKQLMFELVMSLLLCDVQKSDRHRSTKEHDRDLDVQKRGRRRNTKEYDRDPDEERRDHDLDWILSLPVLNWKRDVSSLRVWSIMAEVCADAVVCVMPRYTHRGEMPPEEFVYELVRKGVFELQDATSDEHGFQGDIVGLSLIELIRASYRAGHLAETIIGEGLEMELKRHDWTNEKLDFRLYKAEIVTGLFSILLQLGMDDNEGFQEIFKSHKESWGVDPKLTDVIQALQERAKKEKQESFNLDHVATSRCWYFGDGKSQCSDPAIAFATVASIASEVAPFVLQMLESYIGDEHLVKMSANQGDPDKNREQWLSWKTSQAYEICGSQDFGIDNLGHFDKSPANHIQIPIKP